MAAAEASAAKETESVTNNQTAGVDEGGIVKLHNKHLVILRRGRLFTVRVGDNTLQPVAKINAFAPYTDGEAWYDEMLVSGNEVIVIGYSYSKGGTEIKLFNIDDKGGLTYQSTYVLRSNDYYSSRNYASRLIGDTLIFYTPLYLNFWSDPQASLPAWKRWQTDRKAVFKILTPATRIYRGKDDLRVENGIALHTVQTCKIGSGTLDCSAYAVLGAAGREFYVSQDAVTIWTTPWHSDSAENPVSATVFRLPLNSSALPSSIKAFGSPIDQFSFLEKDGYLNVLLRAEGPLATMWHAEANSPNLAFLRFRLSKFEDGSEGLPNEAYQRLPGLGNDYSSPQNRYIGDTLVYGKGNTWWNDLAQKHSPAVVVDIKRPEHIAKVPLDHSIDRIEALGQAPLLVGTQGRDLRFTVLSVTQGNTLSALPTSTFSLANASQGETRSHGFFYKPAAKSRDGSTGVLGLPFTGAYTYGANQLFDAPSGVIFLNSTAHKLSGLGTLKASTVPTDGDDCVASCVDWYGNSRPLFINGRVFALMGYEIVEGRIDGEKITETRRINYLQQDQVKRASELK